MSAGTGSRFPQWMQHIDWLSGSKVIWLPQPWQGKPSAAIRRAFSCVSPYVCPPPDTLNWAL